MGEGWQRNDDNVGCNSVPEEAEKMDRLHALCRNGRLAMAYIITGFRNGCDLFIDFALIRYTVNQFNDITMLTKCLRIAMFFPGAYGFANVILDRVTQFRGLSCPNMFILHQLDKIRVSRQTSSSSFASERIKEMKAMIADCETETRGIWRQSRVSYHGLRVINHQVQATGSRCAEILADFPDSTQHADQNVRYMIECAADFVGAIMERHRIDMINAGHSFATDHSFRSLVRSFPIYLEKKIVDLKGEIVGATRRAKGSDAGSSTKQGSQSSATSAMSLDAAVEESIGKLLFSQAKTRLALQGALESRKATSVRNLFIYSCSSLVIAVTFFVVVIALFYSKFDSRSTTIARDQNANRARVFLSTAAMTMLLDIANMTGRYDPSSNRGLCHVTDSDLHWTRFKRTQSDLLPSHDSRRCIQGRGGADLDERR